MNFVIDPELTLSKEEIIKTFKSEIYVFDCKQKKNRCIHYFQKQDELIRIREFDTLTTDFYLIILH
jgi:hypothetical protein